MELLLFLLRVFGISLSGALAPGPVTAAAIASGARSRFSGTWMAIGHGAIELPLVILIVLGMDKLLQSTAAQIVIGLAGGAFLLMMGFQLLRSLRAAGDEQVQVTKHGPFLAGIVLSGGNPYFLVWWATVGLALAMDAGAWGIWAFSLFFLVHWSCDLVWLTALSYASFKGSNLMGPKAQRTVLGFCGVALLSFGLWFVGDKGFVLGRILYGRLGFG